MICKRCGNYIPYNNTVCPNCGMPAEIPGNTDTYNTTAHTENTPNPIIFTPPVSLPPHYEWNPDYQGSNQPGSGYAVASMVCGIVGLVLACCIPIVPIVLAIIAIGLGEASLKGNRPGKGMAIAGLVCGIIAVFPQLYILVSGAFFMSGINELIDEINSL